MTRASGPPGTRPGPLVEVVIPVHREERPVERAAASVVGFGGAVRALVVCHNIPAATFARRLRPLGEGVRVIELADGIPSPAGPLNAGLDAATAEWVTCMGSDDYEQPGAPEAWVRHLLRRGPDAVVLPVLRRTTGSVVVPPVRLGRLRDLDPVRDRLCYRTGPLTLVRTDLLRAHRIRMTEGLRTGEDLAWSTHVWMAARRIDLLAPGSPCYVEDDTGGRVTATPFALSEVLEPARLLAREEWVRSLPPERLHALAVRVLRQSVLRPLALRAGRAGAAQPGGATDLDVATSRRAGEVAESWLALDPGAVVALSRAEERAVAALVGGRDDDGVGRAARILADAGPLARVLPARPVGLLDPDARPRHLVATLCRPRQWRGGR